MRRDHALAVAAGVAAGLAVATIVFAGSAGFLGLGPARAAGFTERTGQLTPVSVPFDTVTGTRPAELARAPGTAGAPAGPTTSRSGLTSGSRPTPVTRPETPGASETPTTVATALTTAPTPSTPTPTVATTTGATG